MRQEKEIKIENKTFKIKEVPPMEAQKYKLIELNAKRYRVSQMDVFDNRRICMTYPLNLIPKVGEYKENEDMFRLLMKYVEVDINGTWVKLDNDELIRQNVSAMACFELEKEVIDLTTGFFSSGKLQDYTRDIVDLVLRNVITTLMNSLEQSSPVEEQV